MAPMYLNVSNMSENTERLSDIEKFSQVSQIYY